MSTTLPHVPPSFTLSLRHITAGAKAIAAAQFARCGFDVSVQSGSEKPWFDFIVTRAGTLLKVSVHGSSDGTWSLTDSFQKESLSKNSKRANCHRAIELWLAHHGSRTLCCLVQFQHVPVSELPRIYLASPVELAERMHQVADRLEQATLYEAYAWGAPGENRALLDQFPSEWFFSEERIRELLLATGAKPLPPANTGTSKVNHSVPPADSSIAPLAMRLGA